MDETFEEFVELCDIVGNDAQLTQGSGGNISVKDGGEMYIKASGFLIKDVNKDTGFVKVDYKKLVSLLEAGKEVGSREVLDAKISEGELRPSMETNFHAFLKKYVVHHHSVNVNVLGCLKNAEKHLDAALGDDFAFVGYETPGGALARKVWESDYEKEIIVLQNHGIILHGDDFGEVKKKIKNVESRVKKYLRENIEGFEEYSYKSLEKIVGGFVGAPEELLEEVKKGYIFPDDVVFLHGKKIEVENGRVKYEGDLKEATNVDETLQANHFVLSNAEKLGEVRYLTEAEVNIIVNLDEEKYRRKN
ncbi:MAG: class II aldolase/adducin family protein [archaeon]